jgi:hypothetical protein
MFCPNEKKKDHLIIFSMTCAHSYIILFENENFLNQKTLSMTSFKIKKEIQAHDL